MASLFGSAILSVCVGFQGQYNEACSKAIDAGTRQIGIRQQADQFETQFVQYADKQGHKYLGSDGMATIGFIGFGYRAVRDERVVFKLPNLGLCSSINNEIGRNFYNIKFKWDF